MSNAIEDGSSTRSGGRNHSYHCIVSDLVSLIEHVQASMKLVESAIASEALADNEEIAANVVVLDDVTPRYVGANAALTACNAGLGAALHVLLAEPSMHGAERGYAAIAGRLAMRSPPGMIAPS
jgi:hypothetical protein